MRLQGKVAIVTGAASGFGAEIARQFAKEGAKVALADINEAGAKDVAGPLGASGLPVKCDVTRRADIDALVAATLKAFDGRLDIVVNNAGWSHKNGPLLDVDEAAFDKVYAINVKSIFHMTHAVVPILRRQKSGVILNVGSTAGIRPRPGGAPGGPPPASRWPFGNGLSRSTGRAPAAFSRIQTPASIAYLMAFRLLLVRSSTVQA